MLALLQAGAAWPLPARAILVLVRPSNSLSVEMGIMVETVQFELIWPSVQLEMKTADLQLVQFRGCAVPSSTG